MSEHRQDNSTDDIRQKLDDRESVIEHHLTSLSNELMNILPQVKDIVEKHPIGSVATVLGIGVIMGYLASNSQRRGESTRESLLQSALDPAIQTVIEHLNREGHLPGKDVNPLLTSAIEATEKHLSRSNRTTTQHTPQNSSIINDLVRILVPIGVELGLKALDKNDRSDQE